MQQAAAALEAAEALGVLEIAARLVGANARIGMREVREAMQVPMSRYDTTTAFQMLSAFHKSLRASQGSAALYWAMRIVGAGEDPLVLLRRLIAAAYEDVGLADPQALRLYSSVNGESRQDSTTADMVFSVAEIIRDLSQYMALDPGDVVNTGARLCSAAAGEMDR